MPASDNYSAKTRVPTGPARIAASDSFAAWFLVPRLGPLHQLHPGIRVELVTGNAAVNLARRKADISLRLTKPKEPNLVARRLGIAAWAVYAARSQSRARSAAHHRPS